MDRNGVVIDKPIDRRKVEGPICVNGDFYAVFKDNKSHWFDFKYGIYKLERQEGGRDNWVLKTVSLTLLGAKIYLYKLAKFS